MAESLPAFVARRRPEWEQLRGLLERERRRTLTLADLERLDRLHRRAAADLAHAQSFFPATDVARFLNGLCADAYARIYQPRRDGLAALKVFYAREFPRTVRAHLGPIAVSAAIFVLGLVLGSLIAAFDPAAAAAFVPEGVREHIAEKKMWTDSILSVAPPSFQATRIATNNLTVTFTAFAGGLLLGTVTVAVLFFNGLQLGGIAVLCARGGIGRSLFDFIAAHGPVELSVIVLAGGAGLILGRAIVDPGELPRAQALSRSGREAVRIVLGCAPFLALIGVVEGFVSPGALFPTWAKLSLGLALCGGFWGYLLTAGAAPRSPRGGSASSPRGPGAPARGG